MATPGLVFPQTCGAWCSSLWNCQVDSIHVELGRVLGLLLGLLLPGVVHEVLHGGLQGHIWHLSIKVLHFWRMHITKYERTRIIV